VENSEVAYTVAIQPLSNYSLTHSLAIFFTIGWHLVEPFNK